MESGDVCTLCPQNRQHPDCNSNKCVNKSKKQQGAGIKNGSPDSAADDDTHLSDSQLDSVRTTTTTGSSLHSSCSGSIMHDSADYQWCLDYGYNREYHNVKKFPQSILSPAFERTEISSYDDVAKNIDANLAEIDMETFRSEDIHSILALPAIYSGDLQSSRHQGEKGASVSESILGAFEIDSSVSPRSASEDGSTSMSICKDEPLFSPLREQQIPPLGTISTDSLDCGSSFAEPDLVLTCRANKNNYTIAFEGSGPQFSDDSDYNYLEVEGSSGGDSGMWQDQGGGNGGSANNVHKNGEQGKGRGDMIQSDCVFTTWSKLRRLKETTRSHGKKNKTNNSNKSQSLPNLLRQSVLMSEKNMESSWDSGKMCDSKLGGKKSACLPLFDIQNSQLTRSKDSEGSSGGPVSLLKLFIKQRTPGSGSMDEGSMCSSQSETSEVSSHYQASECLITVITKEEKDGSCNENKLKKETPSNQLFTRNNLENEEETNNNNVLPSETVDNVNVQGGRTADFNGESEEDTSQCFEDSLMEAQAPRSKALQASVIKEEDEPAENSSSDETMQDMKDPFLSDSGTSEETAATKNNVKSFLKQSKRNDKMERIKNVFSTGKSNQHLNIACCATMDDKLLPSKNLDLVPAIQTQGTQTKFVNQRGMSRSKSPNSDLGLDGSESLPTSAAEADEVSLSSSGKNSPMPRSLNNSSPSNRKKSNVLIATTRTCGTQIPVHIKDQEVQTSILDEPRTDNWGFTLKEAYPKGELMENLDEAFGSPMERPGSPVPPEECKENDDNEVDEVEKHESETTEENFEKHQAEKKIYVCYPNYSLPDLSFLRTLTASPEHREGPIVFTPTGRRTPLRQPAQRRSYSSEGRGSRGRPRSCHDFDTLAHHNFGHIKDWDSLKILLPEDIRNIISSMRKSDSSSGNASCLSSHRKNTGSRCSQHSGSRSHSRQSKRLLEGSPCSSLSSSSGSNCSNLSANVPKVVGPHFGVLKEIPPPIPKRSMSLPTTENGQQYPKSILRKSSSSGQCNNGSQGPYPPKCRSAPMMPWVEDAKSKRRSLQEPFHCLLDNIPESLVTNSQHKQLLYNMESSRVQEGGEEQPAMEQFFQGQPNPQGSPSACYPPQAQYKLCRARSDDCCQNYNCNQNSKISPVRETLPNQNSSTESDDDSTSDLQKLLVSSATLNFADALLSGKQISPLQSPSSNLGQQYSNDSSEGDLQDCGCPRGKKVSFCEDVDVQGHHHHHHHHHQEPSVTSPCYSANATKHNCPSSPCNCSSTDIVGEMIKNSCIKNMKAGLLKRLEKAVNAVLDFFEETSNYVNVISCLHDDKEVCTYENVVLNNICPALYTILADGLLPSVTGLFGPLQNSPWRLAENSCQQDPKIQELIELVTYINGDSSFSDNSTKFCGFVFGLLNLKMADQWVTKFLCCARLIQQNYQPTALVFLMSSLPSFLGWQHEVMAMLKPLATLNFQLDLLSASNVVSSTPAPLRASPSGTPSRGQRPVSYAEVSRRDRPYADQIPKTQSWEGLDSVQTPVDENRNVEQLFNEADAVAKSQSDKERGKNVGKSLNDHPDLEIEDIEYPPKSELGDENAEGADNQGFQQLRQKWEKMAGKTSKSPVPSSSPPKMSPSPIPVSPAAAKPPLPNSHRTRELIKKPTPISKPTTQPQATKASPVHLRSKLPSPVRATTSPNRSRPQTPESPRHMPVVKTSPVVGKVAAANTRAASPGQPQNTGKAIRKSMIPVHRPPTSRIPNTSATAKRQPVVARHPPTSSRFN